GPHAGDIDAARGEIITHRLGAPGAERDVVFARAALVGVAFDDEGVLTVAGQPLRLLVERLAARLRQFGLIRLEEDAVADIDDEVLLAARGRSRAGSAIGAVGSALVGAGRDGQT